MAKKDYTHLAKNIIDGVGGKENVQNLTHCMTRLRFTLKDKSKADKVILEKNTEVIQIIEAGGQFQVVIGNSVGDVFEKINQLAQFIPTSQSEPEEKKLGLLDTFINTVSGIFTPMLGAMCGAGMLKGLLIICTTLGWLTPEMGTYRILYAGSDALFYFIPIFLAYTAAEKFKTDKFVAVTVAAALLYPDLSVNSVEGSLTFLNIPVVLISYTNSVIPIILSVYVLSKLEKALKRIIPDICKRFLVPLLSIAIIVPLTYLAIGPVADIAGNALATGYTTAVSINPIIAGGILGLVWPVAVLFGLHGAFIPIVFNNLAKYGRDTLFTITGPNNMAQAGAALGVFLKTKNKGLKAIAGSAAISAVLAGVTEPAIYGVTLKYKRPFYIGAIFSGIAGAIVAAVGAGAPTLLGVSLLTLPGFVGQGFVGFLIACGIAYFGSAIVTFFFGFNDSMIEEIEDVAEPENQEIATTANTIVEEA
ncbi:PTS transporter subunit EIIC [Enterococcus avium]|uniref:PTS transporter subunit EIIC n=1 Tax=Enterococcus avium TaxID=33945 RepID=UPI0025B04956|nr:PTS transporter subunit EIIC [Enterococcus avium]MDN2638027.1 PTS transporter subunit EIIC [Enterococcus avium]